MTRGAACLLALATSLTLVSLARAEFAPDGLTLAKDAQLPAYTLAGIGNIALTYDLEVDPTTGDVWMFRGGNYDIDGRIETFMEIWLKKVPAWSEATREYEQRVRLVLPVTDEFPEDGRPDFCILSNGDFIVARNKLMHFKNPQAEIAQGPFAPSQFAGFIEIPAATPVVFSDGGASTEIHGARLAAYGVMSFVYQDVDDPLKPMYSIAGNGETRLGAERKVWDKDTRSRVATDIEVGEVCVTAESNLLFYTYLSGAQSDVSKVVNPHGNFRNKWRKDVNAETSDYCAALIGDQIIQTTSNQVRVWGSKVLTRRSSTSTQPDETAELEGEKVVYQVATYNDEGDWKVFWLARRSGQEGDELVLLRYAYTPPNSALIAALAIGLGGALGVGGAYATYSRRKRMAELKAQERRAEKRAKRMKDKEEAQSSRSSRSRKQSMGSRASKKLSTGSRASQRRSHGSRASSNAGSSGSGARHSIKRASRKGSRSDAAS